MNSSRVTVMSLWSDGYQSPESRHTGVPGPPTSILSDQPYLISLLVPISSSMVTG